MRIKKVTLIGATMVAIALPVMADMFTPRHSCSKPHKPYQFNSQWELDNFNDEVQIFKQCILDFVDEQNEAAQRHQEAASDAIDEWNNFVNYELN